MVHNNTQVFLLKEVFILFMDTIFFLNQLNKLISQVQNVTKSIIHLKKT